MGDIANDVECQRDGCGHNASGHADTDEGANNGACSMQGCECSGMQAGDSDAGDGDDGDASIQTIVEFSVDRAEREAQLRLVEVLATAPSLMDDHAVEALKKMSAAYCFRTGCSHVNNEHLELDEMGGMGKCTVNGCTCRAFMPQGSPGEPALPEPPVVAAAEPVADGAPGEPGGGPEEVAEPESGIPYRALLVQEGVETSDGRFIEPYATKWRTPPLSLGYQDKTEHGGFADTAAINIGRIDAIVREAGVADGTFDIWGTGVIDDEDPEALKAAHKIREKFLRGVSVDLAIFAAEVEITAVDEDGWPIGERFIVTDCEIGMATVTSFPAFGECQIDLTGEEPSEAETLLGLELPEVGDRIPVIADAGPSFTYHFVDKTLEEREAMTVLASGGPMTPPRDWFAQPAFTETDLIEIPPALCGGRRGVRACPLTITDDGRVYAHLASWYVNHTAMSGRSLKAPRSAGYDLFNTRGVVRVDDGTDLPVGTITLDGGHADLRLDWRAAMAHYDDTRSAVIDCRVGADEHGVWLAGALRPDVDDLSLRRLRAASISGDWRPFGNRHELIAACSVNTPGFPTLRAAVAASAAEAGDELVALVAAGALPTRPEPTADKLLERATAELAYARREREAERLLRTIGG